MKTLQNKFDALNKKYQAINKAMDKAAKDKDEVLYYQLSHELDTIQNKMCEISARMEKN